MHCPAAFHEPRADQCYALIRDYPLATLITHDEHGLCANAVPFLLHHADEGPQLHAHLARNNAQLHALRHGAPSLVVFHGPEHYISPNLYPSKAQHGKVVPTWNYVMVQVRGRAQVIDDSAWLMTLLTRLTQQQEASQAEPWQINDAPAEYIAAQLRGISGVIIDIQHIEGKWKVSQNRAYEDQQGVATGLMRMKTGQAMSQCVLQSAQAQTL